MIINKSNHKQVRKSYSPHLMSLGYDCPFYYGNVRDKMLSRALNLIGGFYEWVRIHDENFDEMYKCREERLNREMSCLKD